MTSREYFVGDYTLNFFPFVPTIDETFLTHSPVTLLKNGLFKDISVLIGTNSNEGYVSLMYLLPELFPNNELKESDKFLTEEQYQAAVDAIFSYLPGPMRILIAHEYRDKFAG